jgi:hypothetical protein
MPLRYALRSGPDGMQIYPVLGSVTWAPRPDQKGRHVVEVAVSDSLGATSVQTFELDVNVVEPAKDEPPPASTPPR